MKFLFGENYVKISQSHYIESILIKFGMQDCKPVSTPMEKDGNIKIEQKINKDEDKEKELEELAEEGKAMFRSLVGAMMWLSVGTRYDIAYAVTTLAKKMSKTSESDLKKAKRVLAYLKKTKNIELKLGGNKLVLQAYCDAALGEDPKRDRDWATCYGSVNSGLYLGRRKPRRVWQYDRQTQNTDYGAERNSARSGVGARPPL